MKLVPKGTLFDNKEKIVCETRGGIVFYYFPDNMNIGIEIPDRPSTVFRFTPEELASNLLGLGRLRRKTPFDEVCEKLYEREIPSKTCPTCKWAHNELSGFDGRCKRYAPSGSFVEISKTDFCGEYESRVQENSKSQIVTLAKRNNVEYVNQFDIKVDMDNNCKVCVGNLMDVGGEIYTVTAVRY